MKLFLNASIKLSLTAQLKPKDLRVGYVSLNTGIYQHGDEFLFVTTFAGLKAALHAELFDYFGQFLLVELSQNLSQALFTSCLVHGLSLEE